MAWALPAAPGGAPNTSGETIENKGSDTLVNLSQAWAEAFTAKAQELMTRHSIDAAMLAVALHGTTAPGQAGVASVRVHIDNPYAPEKATFLSMLAEVNSVRSTG